MPSPHLNRFYGGFMKRQRMSRKGSNKNFKKGMRINKKNIRPRPQRGGIRA